MSKSKRKPIPFDSTPRERALDALALARREGYSLRRASDLARTDPRTVRRHAGQAFRKRGGRWAPTAYDHIPRDMTACEVHYTTAASAVRELFTRLLKTGDTFVLGDAATVMVRWTIQPGAVDELRALRRASLVERPQSLIGETLYRADVDGPTERGEIYVNIGRWRSSDAFYEEVGGTEHGVAPSKRDFELAQRRRAWLIPDE